MLTHLHVKNFAVVEDVALEFRDNFNILSGETGAGKSIIIGAVGIALGGRASSDMIRNGADYAYVEMICEPSGDVWTELEGLDIYPDGGLLVISRKITKGKSISKINGETVTAGVLKSVSGLLIDMYGQHEHQSLVQPARQLDIVDRYAKAEGLKCRANEIFTQYTKVKKEWDRLQLSDEERNRELAFIQFEMDEIDGAHIGENEEEELEKAYRRLANSEKICEALSGVYELCGGNDSASDRISRALMLMSRVSALDDGLSEYEQTLSDAESILSDFNREISSFMDDFAFDEALFRETGERLDYIRKLFGKYGGSFSKMTEYYDKLAGRYEELSYLAEKKAEAEVQLTEVESKLSAAYDELTALRKAKACELTSSIIEALSDLNFNDVRFEIAFDRKENYDFDGIDKVEFMISTNPGECIKPLSFVASGGELSRIMLGIKSVLADNDSVYTLVFDEIDTGISGRTAQMVSEKLARLAKNHQVICITHLAQIAAMADAHYLIEKNVVDNRTRTDIKLLSEEDSISELARILGGVEITQSVFENAREMSKMAGRLKEGL